MFAYLPLYLFIDYFFITLVALGTVDYGGWGTRESAAGESESREHANANDAELSDLEVGRLLEAASDQRHPESRERPFSEGEQRAA